MKEVIKNELLKGPQIKCALPGPYARKILAEDEKYLSPSYTREYPLVVKKAEDVWVEDVDGNIFLDFTAGIGVCNVGHNNKEIRKVLAEQLDHYIHFALGDFYNDKAPLLAKELCNITPGQYNKKAFFTNSGTESVEAAIKLARYHTRKPRILGFIGAFHGRTMGSLAITSSKSVQRKHFSPLMGDVTHVPYPYCYRCPYKLTYPKCDFWCVKIIEEVYFKRLCPPEDIACCIVEPIQGEGGYIVPPDGYFDELTKLLKKYDILIIADEVQSGIGRTGKMLACEHWNFVPDIVCLAKALANGLPLGAIVANEKYYTWVKGSHNNTFGGNALAVSAAIKTIELVRNEYIENAKNMGDYILGVARKWIDEYEFLGDVRGKGLMIGLEFVKNKQTKEEAKELRNTIIYKCFEKGLLLLPSGENIIRFSPPLSISKQQVDTALNIFNDVLQSVKSAL
ncbi:MAG: acetyl ornithine aminotransferase family protein [Planctomycetota bacterium]